LRGQQLRKTCAAQAAAYSSGYRLVCKGSSAKVVRRNNSPRLYAGGDQMSRQ